MDAATTFPTWGYKPDGSAQIFDLSAGETLPAGWETSPTCITNPELATADALTARAEGRTYLQPAADAGHDVLTDAAAPAVDPDAFANALAEIDRLTDIIRGGQAQNDALITEIEAAEAAVETATTELISLRELLAAETTDKANALAKVETLTADLAKATTDLVEAHTALEQATAPAPAPTEAPKAPAKAK
ncbi:hypothetical protein [Methylobacterium brachythecii]|uniref:Uncharacterized protein n=1 Tax=Methylobacterium brachythecii TaxID=1176177 RepID=A0A7W6ANM8_9HYPH|nr:hypothetical protein [Methylobacterium brachythecii]MBB3905124.1 hypothetical protein [Methylobacterium brachythecii]GLS44368.1 hypothetical protein GCM10007884_23560 [Methylobacterium brachythecii]